MKIGVLALQGAFERHQKVFLELSVEAIQVRTPADLAKVDALVMPGGESTTMSQLLESSELFGPISLRIKQGLPVFGTCAGMILLSKKILDGRDDQLSFDAIDIDVQRNAYGRQIDSFEAEIEIDSFDSPFNAVFIRAPRIVSLGPEVHALAYCGDDVVLAKQENILVASFHPELANDVRLHELFLKGV
ncbi:MAG: pyridoxal 5'-phosphate synthase glutaminase subunit PdxT [Actinobacteria bacterium]|nr:pyridoxal 5'-phosphate synthase glutaminase subunit PdxT [Actinomycetota bacterium]MSX98948.1 pyridoxal 5'-phosphate synthase glutaminase subunit PdxT [Actinomycetota bacterium]MSZ98164.1 pyridoxal 5'-phosphate synthase glutaminase subunit PdxT [Actinomycetota bacterium]MTA65127.1 pyridoxal 5'-phosphate synthase glutaminase subunit PdxT [Actinomycetota bacterium]